MNDRRGFTLLELMMVVVIIGILATIALPQYFKTAERARTSEALSILSAIRSAEIRYRSLSPANTYTTALTELDVDIPTTSPIWTFTVAGVSAGSNAVATRLTGTCGGKALGMDLDNAQICTSDPPCATTWGVSSGAC